MDDKNVILIIKVLNEGNHFEMKAEKEIKIEDIKQRCKDDFNYSENNLSSINLFFKDDEGDKNIIKDFNDLLDDAKMIDDTKYYIQLYAEVNKIEENKSIIIENNNITNINNNNDNIINNKNDNDKEIREKNENKELKKRIKKLEKEIIIYKEQIKKFMNDYKKIVNNISKYLNIENIDINIEKKQDKKKEFNIFNSNIEKQNENIIKNEENIAQIIEKNNQILKKSQTISYKSLNQIKENANKSNTKYEFMKKCNICTKLDKKMIYKCTECDNYFVCSECIKNIKKVHAHQDFYEIKYPQNYINQLQTIIKQKTLKKIKYDEIIDKFNNLLRTIFFDKKGNLLIKELNENDLKKIPQICKEMNSINESSIQYFTEYKYLYINSSNLNEEEKIILNKNILLFFDNLFKYDETKLTNFKK